MIFVIVGLVATIFALIIACHWFYVAGRARGFSDCYKMTHTEELQHEKRASH
jgi:hypothetical protein